MKIELDEGYQFGLGVFETVAVRKGKALFLEEHLERMNHSLKALQIPVSICKEWALGELKRLFPEEADGCIKFAVSGENRIALRRENHYTPEDYEQGFALTYSQVLRNETSLFTYHKTFHYGDCILERRALAGSPYQEKIFCNTRGELTEGTVSNLFFVKKGEVLTPKASCGLLPGIVRGFLLKKGAREVVIRPEQADGFEECFITNSLMGIMPVRSLGEITFTKREITDHLRKQYEEEVLFQISGK